MARPFFGAVPRLPFSFFFLLSHFMLSPAKKTRGGKDGHCLFVAACACDHLLRHHPFFLKKHWHFYGAGTQSTARDLHHGATALKGVVGLSLVVLRPSYPAAVPVLFLRGRLVPWFFCCCATPVLFVFWT
nr:hypothetical protein [Pandoravirus massiliensis]